MVDLPIRAGRGSGQVDKIVGLFIVNFHHIVIIPIVQWTQFWYNALSKTVQIA